MRSLHIPILLVSFSFLRAEVIIKEHAQGISIESLYGYDEIKEPVLIALIKSPMMQRLKKIRQYGVAHYAATIPEYTRFGHSVGVMIITRRFGASLGEQIAALLHDVSHTALSHVADYVFKNGDGLTSYQDDVHEWFIATKGIDALLAEYGYENICSNEHKHTFTILEQDLPDLCADRIEYNLSGAFVDGLLTQEQVDSIFRDLRYKDGNWFFKSVESALLFSYVSLQLTEHSFGTIRNFFTYHHAAQALKRAIEIGYITADDMFACDDDTIWHRLCSSDDVRIHDAVDCVMHWDKRSIAGTKELHDLHVAGKFRGVNPWVSTEVGLKRLIDVDVQYKSEYERVKEHIYVGCYMRYVL